MAACNQCGKPAIRQIAGHPLCVDCSYKVHDMHSRELQQHAAMVNFASQQMDEISGIPSFHAPLRMPDPPRATARPTGPVTFNNITVNNSQIASLNTGEVGRIDAALNQLDNHDVRDALQALTQAVIDERAFGETQKNELIELIAYISAQTLTRTDERKPGLIRATLSSIGEAAKVTTAVADAWRVAEPILRIVFGL